MSYPTLRVVVADSVVDGRSSGQQQPAYFPFQRHRNVAELTGRPSQRGRQPRPSRGARGPRSRANGSCRRSVARPRAERHRPRARIDGRPCWFIDHSLPSARNDDGSWREGHAEHAERGADHRSKPQCWRLSCIASSPSSTLRRAPGHRKCGSPHCLRDSLPNPMGQSRLTSSVRDRTSSFA